MWIEDDPEEYSFDFKPTSDYQQGTLTIYSSPKRPKVSKPVFGYKFMETKMPHPKKRKPKKRGK